MRAKNEVCANNGRASFAMMAEVGVRRLLVAGLMSMLTMGSQSQAYAESLKFCVTTRKSARSNEAVKRACKSMEEQSSEISCVSADDRLTCLRMLSTGSADFSVMEPEDVTITTTSILDDNNFLITHQLKMFAESKPQHDVEMIALVKNKYDSTWVTKDKKLCYLGFEIGLTPNYHYHYTSYFERWLVRKECNTNKTLLENRISALAHHFESACIAGPWSLDASYDGVLKSKYKNLCALCGSPVGCYEGDRFFGMQGAISCLLENVGEVAWLSKSAVVTYFEELSSYGFSLLCPDGMFIPLSVNKTCTWITEPRPVILARREVADQVSKIVTDMGKTGKIFHPVIHTTYTFSHLSNVTPPLPPQDYLARFQGFLGSKIFWNCQPDRTVRWCVSSNHEASKCGWLQAAAQAVNIEPEITCIQHKDRASALQAVKDDRCDLFVAMPEEDLHARNMNLTPVAHIISNKDFEASRFAAIVRKDAKFKNFNDLRGKNACFTGYKSIGWNAFFSFLRNSSPHWACADHKAMSHFFNQSCVYGLSEKNVSMPNNLYSLCNQAQFDENLGPEENTFKCLMNGGDVAFVNVSAAKKYFSGFSIFYMNYRILCENEDQQVTEPCFMAETTLGSVLVNKKISKVRKEEIYLLLLSIDRNFGRNFDRETAMFTLYGPYEGQSNVIFPDKTQHLQQHVGGRRNGRTYEEVLESLQEKVACSASGSTSLKIAVSFILSFLILSRM